MARIHRKDICTRCTAISSFHPSSSHFPSGLKEYWNSPDATYSQARGRSRWRNQFLVDYLQSKEITRSKKQVASHIQVLRNMWKGEPGLYIHLTAVARPSSDSLQNIISSLERTKHLRIRRHLVPLSSKINGMKHPLYPLMTTMTIRLRILFRPTTHHLTLNLISLSPQSTTHTWLQRTYHPSSHNVAQPHFTRLYLLPRPHLSPLYLPLEHSLIHYTRITHHTTMVLACTRRVRETRWSILLHTSQRHPLSVSQGQHPIAFLWCSNHDFPQGTE